jgi:hypothetical protein
MTVARLDGYVAVVDPSADFTDREAVVKLVSRGGPQDVLYCPFDLSRSSAHGSPEWETR